MMRPASKEDLELLHRILVEAVTNEVRYYIDNPHERMPANIITATAKLLSDNSITADVRNVEDLKALRDELKASGVTIAAEADQFDYIN